MSNDPSELIHSITQILIEQVIVDTLIAPTRRLLLLLQSQTGEKEDVSKKKRRKGISFYIAQIVKREGFKGFWRGNLMEIFKNSAKIVFTTLFTKIYEPIILKENAGQTSADISVKEFLLFCAVELSTIIFEHPLKVIRIKLATLDDPENPHPKGVEGALYCIKQIFNDEGFFGFYKGFRVTVASAISNAIFLTLNRFIQREIRTDVPINVHHRKRRLIKEIIRYGTPGGIGIALLKSSRTFQGVKRKSAKWAFRLFCNFGATLMLYPYKVVETRIIMNNNPNSNAKEVVVDLLEKEGIRGFYSGVSMAAILNITSMAVYPIARAFAKKFANRAFGKYKGDSADIANVGNLDLLETENGKTKGKRFKTVGRIKEKIKDRVTQ